MIFDLPQFVNVRLSMPCIIYCIKTITLTRVDNTTAIHVYRMQATGQESIEIALSHPLEDITKDTVRYVVIRPWRFNLLDASIMRDDVSAY